MSEPAQLKSGRRSKGVFLGATAILVYLALAKLLLHLLTADDYGYFRDELYYMAAGERLDLGYVDFPPFVAIVAAVTRWLLGDSLLALHLFPVLAGVMVVVLTGLMARELGGGRFAQGMAALATLVAPSFLVMGTFLSMDAFDQLWWVLASYFLLLILKREKPRLWLVFGLVAGLGLLTKITMLYFGFAVFVGLLLTPARRHLLTPWPWLGGVVASAFLLPYVFWQLRHGWPTLEFWADYGEKVDPASPLEFLIEQVVMMQPPTLPLWLAGLYYFFFSGDGRRFRLIGWIYIILLVIFALQNAKFYFLAPAYPVLFAAGAFVVERFVWRRSRGWLKGAYAAILLMSGIVFAPLVVPLLPADTLANITGGGAGIKQERREEGRLPQHFADRFGWENMVATVAGVYQGLPPQERSRACIFTGNYGEAGAIDFFGSKYGLPGAISGHNSYHVWGPGDCTGEILISVGVPRSDLETAFQDVEQKDTVRCEYCMPDEDNLPVYVCRDPKVSLREVWPQVKHFD
ncbi:MAG: glycosyltransferase family 39 protein [Actinomycetota bacterium]|nr:glycosyltransferase family 39 protein [Actinomycetota bacterium]MDQ5830574.1 glycosyltransferase family 39 protein [Actinomycetota bacterium]